MTYCESPGIEDVMSKNNGEWIYYALPRAGKDIAVTTWLKSGKKQLRQLKFNGSKFSY